MNPSHRFKLPRLALTVVFVLILLAPMGMPGQAAPDPQSAQYAYTAWFPVIMAPDPGAWGDPTAANAPAARSKHTAVWTGTEMIVWGGTVPSGTTFIFANTGGRYNNDKNAWTATSLTGAPEGRAAHTAVWTGTEMIVWGGRAGALSMNTGGRYNPLTDSWTAISTTNAPDARYAHTAVWTGTEMIVWGGQVGSASYTNTGGRYNPLTDTWMPLSMVNAPDTRGEQTVVWTGTEMLVWGGRGETGYLNTGGRYDPLTDSWTPMSINGAPTARSQQTAVWRESCGRIGEMIVWGGYDGSAYLNTGGRYNPVNDTWKPTTTLNAPAARAGHTAVWAGGGGSSSGAMLIWGGHNGGDTGFLYNPYFNTWAPLSTSGAPSGREGHTAVWVGSESGRPGEMIVWGGFDATRPTRITYANTGGRYFPGRVIGSACDLIVGEWRKPPSLTNAPIANHGYAIVWTGTEMIVWGGNVSSGTSFTRTNTGGRYNPATDTWTATSTINAPSPRYTIAVWTGTEMIIWGGSDDSGYVNTGGRYNPVTDTWRPISTLNAPEARYSYTAVWTGTEMIVWGGDNRKGFLNTGGRYDPVTDTWKPTATLNAPAGRVTHTAVWTGTEMIVWGGEIPDDQDYYPLSIPANTGGRYNPTTDTWTPTSTRNAPEARSGHTAVWTGSYCGRPGEMIIWGGGFAWLEKVGGRYNPLTDTWTPISTVNTPALRSYFAALWVAGDSSSSGEMFIWGGQLRLGDDGGRYDPLTDQWKLISEDGGPLSKYKYDVVWTGSESSGPGEMIVWGGDPGYNGRYYPGGAIGSLCP